MLSGSGPSSADFEQRQGGQRAWVQRCREGFLYALLLFRTEQCNPLHLQLGQTGAWPWDYCCLKRTPRMSPFSAGTRRLVQRTSLRITDQSLEAKISADQSLSDDCSWKHFNSFTTRQQLPNAAVQPLGPTQVCDSSIPSAMAVVLRTIIPRL